MHLTWDTYYDQRTPHAVELVGSFWWRDILKLTPTFRGISKVQVVCGSTALFWKDLWADQLLQVSHPRAFSYAINEDISVKDFLSITSMSEAFHLPLLAQAHAEMRQLQEDTREMAVSNEPDVWTYILGTETYTAHRYYTFYIR